MRVVAWIGELVACTHRVEELDGLVGACRRNELGLCQIADIEDGRVVCLDSLVARDVPRRPRLEKFDEVSLEVPDQ